MTTNISERTLYRKMKANELMIGDWVMYNPNIFIEDEYEPTKKEYPTQIQSGDDIDLVIEGCYKPIPLTPEILEKNGFIKTISRDGSHYRYTLTEGTTSFSVLYVNGVFQWIFPIDIKYVHKLQHILKFCEIKKEIVL